MCSNKGRVNSNASQKQNAKSSILKEGETVSVRFPKTPLHKGGEPIIARTADGGYRYLGHVPSWDDIKVDRESKEYKRAERDFNVTAQMSSDGKITVKKGGLYARTKTYKDAESFETDVQKRIDMQVLFSRASRDAYAQGRISELEVHNFANIVRTESPSMALKKMNASIRESMQSDKTRLEAAESAKRKINQAIDDMKRKTRKTNV